jgi:hypothetical protein
MSCSVIYILFYWQKSKLFLFYFLCIELVYLLHCLDGQQIKSLNNNFCVSVIYQQWWFSINFNSPLNIQKYIFPSALFVLCGKHSNVVDPPLMVICLQPTTLRCTSVLIHLWTWYMLMERQWCHQSTQITNKFTVNSILHMTNIVDCRQVLWQRRTERNIPGISVALRKIKE